MLLESVIQTASELYTCASTGRNPYFQKEEAVMEKKLFDSLDESFKSFIK